MILFYVASAVAGSLAEVTVRAGVRTAPESAIQVPGGWEGGFEPSGLCAADAMLELTNEHGPFLRGGLNAWGYAPDLDASLAGGQLGGGYRTSFGHYRLEVEGNADGQAFPAIGGASNVRGEVLAQLRGPAKAPLSGGLLARVVEREFFGADDANYSFGELELSIRAEATQVLVMEGGVSGEVNSPALWGEGAPGTQVRPWARVRLSGQGWFASGEYRFTAAFAGETEAEERAVFTPLADYADDVDALSGGGFLQHRVGLRVARDFGKWTVAGSSLYRLRAYEEGTTSVYGAQLRVQSPSWRSGVRPFVGVGVNVVSVSPAYTDAWGWLGFTWRKETTPEK